MTPIYTVPVLLAVWGLSRPGVLVVSVAANVINVGSALVQHTPLEIWLLYSSGLIVIGALAILLAGEREERAQLLGREQAILENAPFGISFVDAQSGRLLMNPAGQSILGQQPVPQGGPAPSLGQLLHPNGQPYASDELPSTRALRGEATASEEALITRTDGQQVPVLERAAPIRGENGRVTGAVVVFQDISLLKELEQLRSEWTAVIAHELRQPTTIILAYAGLLAREVKRDSHSPIEKKAAENVLVSARKLNRMIGDLLDVSRMLAGQFTIQPAALDLAVVVREVVERSSPIVGAHPLRVEVPSDLTTIVADSARIEQVLTNLLSNAAKYGFPESAIDVVVSEQAMAINVMVTNRGEGIPPEELPHLFERFYRTSGARGGPVKGLGLGLFICKGIVQAHGGRIWAESIPGQTTTFHFTLPFERQ
jgi:PAS domain S-box-containing protein